MVNEADHPVFSATLVPHRSLAQMQFAAIVAGIAIVSFAAGVFFTAIGAWPVLGFFGLDVLLVIWAWRASYASARLSETVDVTDHELILRQMRPGRPVAEFRFVRNWVKVDLEENPDTELIGDLSLKSRGHRLVFGRFLAPDERKSLAFALREALAVPHI